MTVDPTLTVSIDRTSLGKDPLVFSAALADGTALGLVGYQAPANIARVTYAPDSDHVHGSEATGAAWGQAMMGVDWMCDDAADETALQAAYADVVEAVGQFSYPVTTQVSGAPAQVWAADMGSVTPPERTYVDLANPDALVVAVTMPVYPIAGSA